MRIAVGSDETTALTERVVHWLRERGWEVSLYGALAGGNEAWPEVGYQVATAVAGGGCEEGILFCWTGTGVSIAANKVPGIRAALCFDAATARGARQWNHANVLAMSLRLTSPAMAEEILEAWFSTPYGGGEDALNVARIARIEVQHRNQPSSA